MKPIPVDFHIGPLDIHIYGIGLAVTFLFAYWYFERRLQRHGDRTDWLVGMFLWVVAAAIVGARAMHVLTNASSYTSHPSEILAIWHGGLSSFGGLLLAVPVGLVVTKQRCPELPIPRAFDLVAPVLVAAWALGRLLGPQLMYAGGGHRTNQWFGMYYAGQSGRRLPVPIFQALADFVVFLVLIWLERRLERWPDGSPRRNYPSGAVIGTAMLLWGIERFFDQRLFLTEQGVGSLLVQIAAVALALAGAVVLVVALRRWRAWLAAGAPGGHDPEVGTHRPDEEAEGDEEATVESRRAAPASVDDG